MHTISAPSVYSACEAPLQLIRQPGRRLQAQTVEAFNAEHKVLGIAYHSDVVPV